MRPGQPVRVTNRRRSFHHFSERQGLSGFTAILIIQSVRSVFCSSHCRRQYGSILPRRGGTRPGIGPGMQSTTQGSSATTHPSPEVYFWRLVLTHTLEAGLRRRQLESRVQPLQPPSLARLSLTKCSHGTKPGTLNSTSWRLWPGTVSA